jgi:hypothetical protein
VKDLPTDEAIDFLDRTTDERMEKRIPDLPRDSGGEAEDARASVRHAPHRRAHRRDPSR